MSNMEAKALIRSIYRYLIDIIGVVWDSLILTYAIVVGRPVILEGISLGDFSLVEAAVSVIVELP